MNYSPFGPAPNSSNNPNVIPMMGVHNHNNNNRPQNTSSYPYGNNNNNMNCANQGNYNSFPNNPQQGYNTNPYNSNNNNNMNPNYQRQGQQGGYPNNYQNPNVGYNNNPYTSNNNQPLANANKNNYNMNQQQQPPMNNNNNINNNNRIPMQNPGQAQATQSGNNFDKVTNPEHAMQLQQLRSRYAFQIQPTGDQSKTVAFIDIDIPNQKIPVRIELSSEFPKIKPTIFVRKQVAQQNIDDKTWKIRFDSLIRWDGPQSSLLSVVLAINQAFQQFPPLPDYLLQQIQDIKNTVNEAAEKTRLQELDAQKVFPGLSQIQYQELISNASFAEPIMSSNYISLLRKRVGEIADFNLKLSSDLIEQQAHLDNKKKALVELNQQYEGLKNELFSAASASNNIQERFGIMSILQAVTQKIDELEEQSTNQQKTGSFDEDIRLYKERRQKYHLLVKKREKLLNSN